MSIIDTLTAGFNTATKNLVLATIPVLLDLFIWLGPKLSIAPVIGKMVRLYQRAVESLPATASPGMDAPEMFEATTMMLDTLQNTVGRTNLLALLAWGRLGIPSIAGVNPIESDARWIIEISEYWEMLLFQLLIWGVGLFLACIFLGMLGQQTREERLDVVTLARRVPMYWLYMALIFMPFGIFLVFSLSTSILLGPFAIFAAVGILWLMLYMSFLPQAITFAEQKPLGALRSSFLIVRSNFWTALGLILLINVINTGLGLMWQRFLMNSVVGTLVAILGNSYVGTALTLALFIFYRDRVATQRESREQQRSA